MSLTFRVPLLALALCSACPKAEPPPQQTKPTEPTPAGIRVGTVRKIGESTWVLEGGAGRFCLTGPKLKPEFLKEGLRLQISGQALPIPPNVRMACRPFALKTIEIAPN